MAPAIRESHQAEFSHGLHADHAKTREANNTFSLRHPYRGFSAFGALKIVSRGVASAVFERNSKSARSFHTVC
jgi:hypothetical protein